MRYQLGVWLYRFGLRLMGSRPQEVVAFDSPWFGRAKDDEHFGYASTVVMMADAAKLLGPDSVRVIASSTARRDAVNAAFARHPYFHRWAEYPGRDAHPALSYYRRS